MVDREQFLRGLSLFPLEGMLTVREAEFLYETAQNLTGFRVWVELGTFCGRGLWSAGCGLSDNSQVYGVDRFDGMLPVKEGSEKIEKYAPGSLCLGMAEAAVSGLMEINEVQPRVEVTDSWNTEFLHDALRVDVLVVDASHDYESVSKDLDAWLPKMKPNGLILGHDYTAKYPGVKTAFDERFGSRVVNNHPTTRFCWVQL